MRGKIPICIGVLCVLLTVGTAEAQFFKALNQGLFWVGFRVDGTRNPITKGFQVEANRFFINETMDFGAGTLTLTGPLVLNASMSKRPIKGLSYGMNTSGQPLQYTLTLRDAVQDLTITGQVTIETQTSINGAGWYRKVVKVTNRGTLEADGVLVEADNNLDFDLGPVDITGNIFLDAAASLMDALGADSSGLRGITSAGPLIVLGEQEVASLDELDLTDPEQVAAYVNSIVLTGVAEAAAEAPARRIRVPVPEPSTLALLAVLGSSVLLRRPRRYRRR